MFSKLSRLRTNLLSLTLEFYSSSKPQEFFKQTEYVTFGGSLNFNFFYHVERLRIIIRIKLLLLLFLPLFSSFATILNKSKTKVHLRHRRFVSSENTIRGYFKNVTSTITPDNINVYRKYSCRLFYSIFCKRSFLNFLQKD